MKLVSTMTLLIATLMHSTCLFAQKSYNDAVDQITAELINQIDKTKASKLVITSFRNNDGTISELGQLISDEVILECAIQLPDVQVFDRNELVQIKGLEELSEQNLITQKVVNAITDKTNADLVITGVITPFGEYFRLMTKVHSRKKRGVIGGTKSTIVLQDHLEALFDTGHNQPNKKKSKGGSGSTADDDDCQESKKGDICLKNLYVYRMTLKLYKGGRGDFDNHINTITIQSGLEECIYDLDFGLYYYTTSPTGNAGQLKLESCKLNSDIR